MIDQKIVNDFQEMTDHIERVRVRLDSMYYSPEVGTLRNRPIMSMLISACTYLNDNINVLLKDYKERNGAK
jgi:hypothetical protein